MIKKYLLFFLNFLVMEDLHKTISIISDVSTFSGEFRISFYEKISLKKGIDILFDLLDSFILKEYYSHINLKYKKTIEKNELQKLSSFESLLTCLHNLSKISINFAEIWKNKLDIFQNLATKCEKKSKLLCFTIISNIATEDEIKKISVENTEIIESIADQIEEISNLILDKNCDRQRIEINKELVDLAFNENGWHLIEV